MAVERQLEELRGTIASGHAILFTGAGFSHGVRDGRDRLLPTSEEMAGELWQIIFGDEPRDRSSLADLFDVALSRSPGALADYLRVRLTVGDGEIPPHIVAWLSAPWRRIYTLNVDDVEQAVMRQAALPHRLRSYSGVRTEGAAASPERDERRVVDVVHLNGMVGGDVTQVTFSTLQYAERLCDRQPSYEHLAEDLERSPFVFVGTTLDEVVLWQHVMGRARHGRAGAPPPSYLVTRSLTRARALLLDTFGIAWLPMSAEDAAAALFRRER